MNERRKDARYRRDGGISCQARLATGTMLWTGVLWDLSATGLGILADVWLPPGIPLVLEIDTWKARGTQALAASTCHATRVSFRHFLLGVRLGAKLSAEDLAVE